MTRTYPDFLIAHGDDFDPQLFVIGHTIGIQPEGELHLENVAPIFTGDIEKASSWAAVGIIRKLLSEGQQVVIMSRTGIDPIFPPNIGS